MPSADDQGRLGRYVLEERLGSGGFGVVYGAYDEELDRHVALKFVRPTGADRNAATRLVREGRAMAQLSHPNVVNVFDVGRYDIADWAAQWPEELPSRGVYIVMELVEGGNLKLWLLREERAWQDILRHFIAAGEGLAAAHAQGILHRDFKPSNVLIGDDGRPRVVDFGLARALSGSPTSDFNRSESAEVEVFVEPKTDPVPDPDGSTRVVPADDRPLGLPLTATGAEVGTPAYMAPEQLAADDVGPWTDQYNFCVALYEGLFGERPFPSGADVMRKRKRAGDIRPIPAKTPVPPRVRNAILRGLHADPDRRWSSMKALLDTLAPPAPRRWWIPAAAVGLASAVGLAAVSGRDDRHCNDAADRAEAVWDDARRAAVRTAVISTGTKFSETSAERIVGAMDHYVAAWTESRRLACEAEGRGDDDAFDSTMRCLSEALSGVQSLAELLTEADTTVALNALTAIAGLPDPKVCLSSPEERAAPPAEIADEVEAIEFALLRVVVLRRAGRSRQALKTARRAVGEARQIGFAPLTVRTLLTSGIVQMELGNLEEAERNLTEAYYMATEIDDEHRAAAAAAHMTVLIGDLQVDEDEAEGWIRHAESHLQRGGADKGIESTLAASLGYMAENRGNLETAVAHYRRAEDLLTEKYGPGHIQVSIAQQNLGRALFDMGEHEEGLETVLGGLETARMYLGADHPHLMSYYSSLGNCYLRLGEYDKAIQYARQAVEVVVDGYGRKHQDYPGQAMNLANAYTMVGRYDEALEMYGSALDTALEVRGPDHPVIALIHVNQGQILLVQGQGEPQKAQSAFERALTILEAHHGPEHRDNAEALNGIGRSLLQQGKYERARQYHLDALEILEKTLGPDHFEISRSMHDIGLTYLEGGRPTEAIPRFEKSLSMREGAGVDPLFVAESHLALAQSKFASPDPADDEAALAHARKARDLVEQLGPSADILRSDLEDVLRAHDPEHQGP